MRREADKDIGDKDRRRYGENQRRLESRRCGLDSPRHEDRHGGIFLIVRGKTDLGQSPLHGALDEGLFCGPAALSGLAEGFLGGLEEPFGFGEAGQVGCEAGDFGD